MIISTLHQAIVPDAGNVPCSMEDSQCFLSALLVPLHGQKFFPALRAKCTRVLKIAIQQDCNCYNKRTTKL
jgi:hypothetical protein